MGARPGEHHRRRRTRWPPPVTRPGRWPGWSARGGWQPASRYRAFVVPTFAAGAARGRRPRHGRGPAGSRRGPRTGQVSLPVYFSYAFTTGHGRDVRDAGPPAASPRRLRPPPPGGPSRSTRRGGAWSAHAGATVMMQGALRPLPRRRQPAPSRCPTRPTPRALAAAVSVAGAGLQLRPPLYGQDYAGGTTVVAGDRPRLAGRAQHRPAAPARRRARARGRSRSCRTTSPTGPGSSCPPAWPSRPPADPDLAGALGGSLAARTAGTRPPCCPPRWPGSAAPAGRSPGRHGHRARRPGRVAAPPVGRQPGARPVRADASTTPPAPTWPRSRRSGCCRAPVTYRRTRSW